MLKSNVGSIDCKLRFTLRFHLLADSPTSDLTLSAGNFLKNIFLVKKYIFLNSFFKGDQLTSYMIIFFEVSPNRAYK